MSLLVVSSVACRLVTPFSALGEPDRRHVTELLLMFNMEK